MDAAVAPPSNDSGPGEARPLGGRGAHGHRGRRRAWLGKVAAGGLALFAVPLIWLMVGPESALPRQFSVGAFIDAAMSGERPGGRFDLGLGGLELELGLGGWIFASIGALLMLALAGAALWVVSQRPWWVIGGVVIWTPLETAVLARVPWPASVDMAVQMMSEAAIYAALLAVLARRVLESRAGERTAPIWRVTPVDLPLAFLAGWCLLVSVWHDVPLVPAAMNLRSLLRYAALYALVVQLSAVDASGVTRLERSAHQERQERRVRFVLWAIALGALFQVTVAALQVVAGPIVEPLLRPRSGGVATRGARLLGQGREMGAVYGTLGDTVFLSVFGLVGLAVWLGRPVGCALLGCGLGSGLGPRLARNSDGSTPPAARLNLLFLLQQAAVVLALLAMIARTYSRSALILAVPVVVIGAMLPRLRAIDARGGIDPRQRRRLVGVTLLVVALMPLLVLVRGVASEYLRPEETQVSILDNVTAFASAEYLERAMNNRLGAVVGTAPTVLAQRPLTGYGLDTDTAVAELNAARPNFLTKLQRRQGFEDVYWVAMLAYAGVPGLLAFFAVHLALLRSSMRAAREATSPVHRWACAAAILLVGVAFPLQAFVRAMEFRSFGLYLWLLPALAISLQAARGVAVTEDPKPA